MQKTIAQIRVHKRRSITKAILHYYKRYNKHFSTLLEILQTLYIFLHDFCNIFSRKFLHQFRLAFIAVIHLKPANNFLAKVSRS